MYFSFGRIRQSIFYFWKNVSINILFLEEYVNQYFGFWKNGSINILFLEEYVNQYFILEECIYQYFVSGRMHQSIFYFWKNISINILYRDNSKSTSPIVLYFKVVFFNHHACLRAQCFLPDSQPKKTNTVRLQTIKVIFYHNFQACNRALCN